MDINHASKHKISNSILARNESHQFHQFKREKKYRNSKENYVDKHEDVKLNQEGNKGFTNSKAIGTHHIRWIATFNFLLSF